jgi:predicted adenylyl cyclase CyaB
MNIEYEIKYEANRSMLLHLIGDLSYIGSKQQIDTYYDTTNNTLFLNAVFLRKRNNKAVEIKYNLDKADVSHFFCNETNFKLPFSEEAKKAFDDFLSKHIQPVTNNDIFKKYQLQEFVVIKKNREIYEGKEIEVSYDEVEGLGEFIEIEAKTKEGIDLLRDYMSDFKVQRITTGYVELYLKKYNHSLYKQGKYLVQ